MLLGLLRKSKRTDILQYTLVLLADLCASGTKFTSELAGEQDVYAPLVKLLKNDDETLPLFALRVLLLLLTTTQSPDEETISATQEYCRSLALVKDTNEDLQNLSAQALSSVLRNEKSRKLFWADEKNVGLLQKLLDEDNSVQLRYNSLLVLWLISFDQEISSQLDAKLSAISLLTKVLKESSKEKITRVALSTLKNLAKLAPKETLRPMLHAGLLTYIKVLSERRWSDDEIQEDLEYLSGQLDSEQKELTSFDHYAAEVESGELSWTPAHKSDEFWQANAKKLQNEDNKIIKQLARLMSTTQDKVALAVAANDIGMFIKACPDGRIAVQKIGAKTKVMELMSHADSDVRYEALNTVQIMLSRSWEK